jgi:[acyl-carrier-protein] S-malonyltransferase
MNETTLKTDFAMVFPGQGSQSVGMLATLAAVFPVVTETFAAASSVLGYDLWERVQQGPSELLNQTACTQPAMLAAGVATWRCWQEKTDKVPAVMAGHSLGEYTALVCADSLGFEEAVGLVEKRGQYMQNAVPDGQGAMAAILGLDDEQVHQLCAEAAEGEVVSAVNFNSPGQVVIAGQATAIERAMKLAKAAGAKRALLLPVSVPSHCSLMKPAAERFAQDLAGTALKLPSMPVLHNVDVSSKSTVEGIRAVLSAQLYQPVRWVETIHAMKANGITRVLEMGPGKVLAGLNKRIEKSMPGVAVQTAEDLDKVLAELA